ncbi:MAG: hypothetical protein LBD01_05290 [Puniceicoccales bacterium]|jgi:hypothetical protein|nr:hypothetical protein [Puniceicoccales bacterium]
MRVRIVRDSFKGCPSYAKLDADSDQTVVHLTVGSELYVQAIFVFSRITIFFVIDNFNRFTGKPAWLFEITDWTMPDDWIISAFNYDPSIVIGPRIIAENIDAYNRFAEQEPDMENAMHDHIPKWGGSRRRRSDD